MDLSKLSDDDLQKLYEQGKTAPTATTAAASPTGGKVDLSKLSDDELHALATKAAGGPAYEAPFQGLHDKPYEHPLEYPDAPTTAYMPLPKTAGALDLKPGEKTIPFTSSMAAQFGPLLTSDPQARAEIYEKHIPGAKATKDKYGNPMIEYDGKKYYTARPGEFDAMDAGRAGLAVAASAPAIAMAPASVTGAALAGGAIAGGQSLAEDALTRAAGGTSQQIDPSKAGISAALATIIPFGLGKVALPIVGRIYAAARSGTPLTDAALVKLGLTSEQVSSLTPELRDRITSVARQTFGNQTAAGSAYRQGLAKEFELPQGPGGLTRGEISGDPGQIAKEQTLASPGAVPGSGYPRQVILDNRIAQDQQLSQAQEMLRTQAGGGPPLKPEQAGQVLKQGYDTADQAAKARVDQLYGAARDPFAVEAAGGRSSVPPAVTGSLHQATRAALAQDNIGRIALGSEASNLTPNAAAALSAVENWSKSTMGPRANLVAGPSQPSMISSPALSVYRPQGLLGEPLPPGATVTRTAIDQPGVRVNVPAEGPSAEATLAARAAPPAPGGPRITGPSPTGQIAGDVNWGKVEDLRQALVGYEEAAVASGNKQDIAAVQQIKKSFDDQFGPLNPLFGPAREAHADRMATFKPGGSPDQDKATKTALELLQGPEGGAKVVNTIFGSGMKTGEAAQMLDHLNTQVFPTQPAAREVMKEQALRRLVTDADGTALSPQKTVTALDKALDGDREGPLYEKLFSKDEMARLQRFRELQDTLAKSRTPINPPGSGSMAVDAIKHLVGTGIGAKIGATIGAHFGMPEAGMYLGGTLGTVGRTAMQRIQAARAINPPANYGVQGLLGTPAMAAGQAAGAANQQGQGPGGLLGTPVERLMQNAWGGP